MMKSQDKKYKVSDNGSDIADVFLQLFVNRTDTYAIQKADGSYVRIPKPLTKDVLKRHFTGETTVGAYMVNPGDQTTKTLCFDVDPEHVDDPGDVTSKILKSCSERFPGKAVLLEASRHPDPSYHVWVFFEPSIPAKAARYLGRKIMERAGVVVELFPKQDVVKAGEFGNLVKLPLGLHQQAGKRSCFLDPATFKPLNPTCLFDVEGCSFSEKDIQQAIALADRQREVQAKLEPTPETIRKGVEDLFEVPCVKAFRDHVIPPGSRHKTAAKNLTILYRQARGTWEGFEVWAEELAENKPQFTAKNITDWRSWVEEEPRGLNCAELRGFITSYVADFSCEGCPLRERKVRLSLLGEPRLHPAGGITSRFVYEPIGFGEYAYKTLDGKKGIVTVSVEYEDEKTKKRPHWFITVEGARHHFKEKPRDTWLFYTPRRDVVEAWVKGKRKSLPIRSLWTRTLIYYKTFLDLPRECEYHILVLGAAQSWLIELLSVVFYIGIQGEFGGGKTVAGQAAVLPCRHGYQTGNLSPAFVARMIEKQKLTLFVDELDSVAGSKDSDLYQIFRQGYHRSGTYSRINPDTLKEEIYHVFGTKLYTAHSTVETALQTRVIPLHIRETGSVQYPVIGEARVAFGKALAEEWWLWYMDHILEVRNQRGEVARVDMVDMVDLLGSEGRLGINDQNVDETAEKIRESLFQQFARRLSEGQLSQLSQLTGRNVELAYLMFALSNLVGVNMDKEIMAAFEQKKMEESEQREIGFMGILRDVLTEIWLEKKDNKAYLTESGEVKVANLEVYNRYNQALREAGYKGVSPSKFKGYLTEFGFSDVLNRKKLKILIPGEEEPKSRLCNIFSPRVLRKLDVEITGGSEALLVRENIQAVLDYFAKAIKDEEGYASLIALTDHLRACGVSDPRKLIDHMAGMEWRSKERLGLELHPEKPDKIRLVKT